MHKITYEELINALNKCVDPELGVGIVDIGLIYNIKIDESNNVNIEMTMTSPMCPVTSIILADVQLRAQSVPDAGKVDVDLVWEPSWSPEMMSEEIKATL
jgi:metal-sulfur cluster biosynthetic enzyme